MYDKLKDVTRVMQGKDLEEKPAKRKATTKSVSKTEAVKKPKAKVTDEAKFEAFDYAAEKDVLSKDVRAALKGQPLTDGLKQMLQVLLDNEEFKVLVADRDGVLPSKDDYYLEYSFVDKEDCTCTVMAEAMLSAGQKLDNLEKYNMFLKVVKKRKFDDSLIEDDEPSEREIEETKNRLRTKYQ